MELIITKRAAKGLGRMPPKHRTTMLRHLQEIASDPLVNRNQVVHMVGTVSSYRVRVADWRAIYRVGNNAVTVDDVATRGETYR